MLAFFQLIRFLGIGFLNTAVDFAVLNFLASSFGIYTGAKVGFLNIISFSCAVLHSFVWNKYWAFSKKTEGGLLSNIRKFLGAAFLGIAILVAVVWGARFQFGFGYYLGALLVLAFGEVFLWKAFRVNLTAQIKPVQTELFLFLSVTVIGALINSGIVAGVTGRVAPLFGLNQELWTNLVKAGATAVSLVWNFVGYKLLVFRR